MLDQRLNARPMFGRRCVERSLLKPDRLGIRAFCSRIGREL